MYIPGLKIILFIFNINGKALHPVFVKKKGAGLNIILAKRPVIYQQRVLK